MTVTETNAFRMINGDINEPDLVWINANDAPFTLHGIFFDEKESCYLRMPKAVAEATSPNVTGLNYNTAGGRLRFRTDSSVIALAVKLHRAGARPNIAYAGSAGFDLYEKGEEGFSFFSTFVPPSTICTRYEKMVRTDGTAKDYILNFPLYGGVRSLYIGLKVGSTLEAPEAYPNDLPVVFYGSSITQGASACRPGISYQGYLSRWLNFDYVNLGFSGSCKAEPSMAEYFENLPMKAFVYDFDHNVRNSEELEAKHLPFYRRIRAAHPNLPILFISAPDVHLHKGDFYKRREIILRNFEQAKAEGDENLYFVDGATLFGEEDHLECSVDGTHPNDLGFYRMAQTLRPVLKEMLKK